MAAKKVGIGKKPTSNKTPNLDEWVEQRNPKTDKASSPSVSQEKTTPESVSQTKPKMKRLTIDVTEELHRAIKMKAVEAGTPMADMLRSLLESNYL